MRFALVTTTTNKYRGIPGTTVFFQGKYRGRNFEYRPSLFCMPVHVYVNYGNDSNLVLFGAQMTELYKLTEDSNGAILTEILRGP